MPAEQWSHTNANIARFGRHGFEVFLVDAGDFDVFGLQGCQKFSTDFGDAAETVGEPADTSFKAVSTTASVSKMSISVDVQIRESAQQASSRLGGDFVLCFGRNQFKDRAKGHRWVIVEVHRCSDATAESRVASNHRLHLDGVARQNHHQLVALIFHAFKQRLNGFPAVLILAALVDQRVGFVDEQNSIERLVNFGIGFGARLSGVLGNQTASIGFDQVTFFQNAQGTINLGNDPRDGRFPGPWISDERHVQTRPRRWQSLGLAMAFHRQKIGQRLNLFLDSFESDQAIQLGPRVGQALFRGSVVGRCRLLGLFFCGGGDLPTRRVPAWGWAFRPRSR